MELKITLPELVSRLASSTNTTKRMSELFMRELFATITQALIDGENVTIKDLGQFRRVGNGLEFVPAKKLAETLNQPFEAFEPVEIGDDVTDDMLNEVTSHLVPESELVPTSDETQQPPVESTIPILPPPFKADVVVTPDLRDGEDVPAMDESSVDSTEANAMPSALISQEEPPMVENESTHQLFTAADMDNAKREAMRKALWRGIAIGAISMLALCALCWLMMSPNHSTETAQDTDTVFNADTVALAKAEEPQVAEPVVTDTTSTAMYLSRMAKKHYGRAEFWVYIYEENKSLISDPNNIPPGTIVVIPPASKYDIDANNKASVERAKRRSYELFSKK